MIISGGGGSVQSYGVGANVTATARLAGVQTGSVVLEVEGRQETMSFADLPPGTGVATVAPPGPAPVAPSVGDPATSMEPDAVIARYRAAIHRNPQRVMDRLGPEITAEGYRIRDLPQRVSFLPGFARGLWSRRSSARKWATSTRIGAALMP